MPTQFCKLPYISIIHILKVTFVLFESVFLYSAGILCNVWCCSVGNVYHVCDISIIYCSGIGFLFLCLSELLSGNLHV